MLTLRGREPEALLRRARRAPRGSQRAVVDGKVVLERERGHELIPRVIEALPVGRIDILSMHRPTLSDVFVKLTGRSLQGEPGPDSEAATASSMERAIEQRAAGPQRSLHEELATISVLVRRDVEALRAREEPRGRRAAAAADLLAGDRLRHVEHVRAAVARAA